MVARIKQLARRLHGDTAGAMSVEMVLILAFIGVPILILLFAFRKQIVSWFQGQAEQLDSGP